MRKERWSEFDAMNLAKLILAESKVTYTDKIDTLSRLANHRRNGLFDWHRWLLSKLEHVN